MSEKTKIAIVGASGRMGQMLIKTASENADCALVCVTERPGHEWIGQDLGVAMGGAALDVPVLEHPKHAFEAADVVIDFTSPVVSVMHAELAVETGTALVIGTTGFDAGHIEAINASAQNTPIVRAGNMSLGVNLLMQLTKRVAAALDTDFDIEVIEAHHRHKVDAPSGTALMLGEAAAQGRGVNLEDVRDSGRDGITGARKTGDIGFTAIRGGDVVGEHDVVFAADGERIVLRHLATDRAIFARGAIKAAIWATKQAPGAYDMLDVLGMND